MLQIEDIRRSERNDVLPIPISPSAVVKTPRYSDIAPNDAMSRSLLMRRSIGSYAAQVNGSAQPRVKAFPLLGLQIPINHP
jgi:hypothetical protein